MLSSLEIFAKVVFTMEKPKTLGLIANHLMTWGGGIDLFAMLLDGLRNAPWKSPPQFVLFVQGSAENQAWTDPIYTALINSGIATLGNRIGRRSFAQLAGYYNVDQLDKLHQALDTSIPVRIFRDAQHLDALSAALNVDCLLPVPASLAPEVKTPALGYIPDLQHIFFPEFFSQEEIIHRSNEFALLTDNVSHVIVNSLHTAKTSQEQFAESRASYLALPFAAAPKKDWLEQQPSRLEKYDLPESYFLVSNQFWIHKNHQTLFQAFALGIKQNWSSAIGLVCTGDTHDYRQPDYFQRLQIFLVEHGLVERVQILGHIPKRDQIEIMKNSIAVVQPTLFEGGPGGGSVYDAISLGIPAILSDIEINKELDGCGFDLHFFPSQDHYRLASVMNSYVQASNGKVFSSSELIEAGNKRRRELGVVLASAVEAAEAARLNAD